MSTEIPSTEIDSFLPKGTGHWNMGDYDVFADREAGSAPTVTLCRKNWDYLEMLKKIEESKCLTAWNTAFKVIARDEWTFFYLTNDRPVSGNGIRFIANVSTNQEFLADVVKPLFEAGFIPQEVVDWFTKDD